MSYKNTFPMENVPYSFVLTISGVRTLITSIYSLTVDILISTDSSLYQL